MCERESVRVFVNPCARVCVSVSACVKCMYLYMRACGLVGGGMWGGGGGGERKSVRACVHPCVCVAGIDYVHVYIHACVRVCG